MSTTFAQSQSLASSYVATFAFTLRIYFLSLLPFKTETATSARYRVPLLHHAYFSLLPISLYCLLSTDTFAFPYLPHSFLSLSISILFPQSSSNILSIFLPSFSFFVWCDALAGSFSILQFYADLFSPRAVHLRYYWGTGLSLVLLRGPNSPRFTLLHWYLLQEHQTLCHS